MKRKKSGMNNKTPILDFFVSIIFIKQEPILFLKNNYMPRGNQPLWAYFSLNHDGMSDQNRWHSRKTSKIKASSGFWGRFSKPQKFEFYRWHSVFGAEKRFSGSERKKSSLLFLFLRIDKKEVFKKTATFWKNFFDKF